MYILICMENIEFLLKLILKCLFLPQQCQGYDETWLDRPSHLVWVREGLRFFFGRTYLNVNCVFSGFHATKVASHLCV